MKSSLMAALVIIYFLLVAGRSSSARLLKNDLFIASVNPSAFDPNLNSVGDGHVEKDAVECDPENRPWSSSAVSYSKNSLKESKKLSFRLSSTIQNIKKANESTSTNKDEGVLNLQPKGIPSLKVNSMQMTEQRLSKSRRSHGVGHMQMTEQRLSKSKHSPSVAQMQMTGQQLSKSRRSPGVGHMQMTRRKSQTTNVDIHRSNGEDKSKKRKLGSSPSPVVGN